MRAALIASILVLAVVGPAQSHSETAHSETAQSETAQSETEWRTPWGDPDLQGIWSNATLTPLERPTTTEKEYLSEDEAEELNRTGLERTLAPIPWEVRASGELNEVWLELGEGVRDRRTSLVVDPPNGRVPFKPEGLRRRNLELGRLANLLPTYSYEDRALSERCLLTGGLFIPNPFYLNNHQIFQTPDHIAVKSEVMNEVRIIPLARRRLPDSDIKLWSGVSRGRWEGDTLVVESSHYTDEGGLIGATEELRLVERFTRVDADTIDYELTVTDPASYTRPWTLINNLRRIEGPIYEYACHEGNYSLVNILTGVLAKGKEEGKKEEGQPQEP